jgi:hypothetical protein
VSTGNGASSGEDFATTRRETNMAAKVTNQGKGITTKTSDHTYLSGPPDVCWDPPVKLKVPHVNHVKTEKAVEHTSGKTLFQNGNVIRVGEALEPSEPPHGDIGAGGGVTSHTYRKEARAKKGSPNVRAEGKPPARTKDPTSQNHSNTKGTIKQKVTPGELEDNPEEFLKRCSFKEAKIKCSHWGFVDQKEIDVWRGDIITVQAHRYNAKEPNEDVSCINEPHMKWKVSRTGGVNLLGVALDPMEKDFEGDTLVLPIEFTAPMGSITLSGNQERNLSDDAKRQYIGMKNARANELAQQRGSSRVEGQDTQLAYQQVKTSIEAKDKELQKKNQYNMKRAMVSNLANLAQFLVAWRAAQNPVKIVIAGVACSGSKTYTVFCYPNDKFSFELPLDGIIAAGRFVSRAFEFIRSFGQLANVNVEGGFKIPGDVKIVLEFQWKEKEAEKGQDADYVISREAELAITGQFFEIKAELGFPLANFLALIPVGGGLAAKALNWIIKKLGADASIGAGFSISCSASLFLTLKWNKKDGWEVEGGAKITIDIRVYLYARIRWSDSVLIQAEGVLQADPAFVIEGSKDGVKLKTDDFMVRFGFAGTIHVDTWFYTFHETGTWFPESWTSRIRSREICTIIGN